MASDIYEPRSFTVDPYYEDEPDEDEDAIARREADWAEDRAVDEDQTEREERDNG